MSQPRFPNFAKLGTGVRRAMWRELELWTGTSEAQAKRVEQERVFDQGEPLIFPIIRECSHCEASYRLPPVIPDTSEIQRFELNLCEICWTKVQEDYNRDIAHHHE